MPKPNPWRPEPTPPKCEHEKIERATNTGKETVCKKCNKLYAEHRLINGQWITFK